MIFSNGQFDKTHEIYILAVSNIETHGFLPTRWFGITGTDAKKLSEKNPKLVFLEYEAKPITPTEKDYKLILRHKGNVVDSAFDKIFMSKAHEPTEFDYNGNYETEVERMLEKAVNL